MPIKTEGILGARNVICQRHGCQIKSTEMRIDWEGLIVCPRHWKPKHPYLMPRPQFPPGEGQPKALAPKLGEPNYIYLEIGDITKDDI